MNNAIQRTRRLSALALGLSLAGAATSALADDTEIFLGRASATDSKPNILFVIDTSGSMSTNVVTQNPYDPATLYSGSCDPNRVYWQTGTATTPPNCATSSTNNWVPATAFKCESARSAMERVGYTTQAPAAQWRTSSGGRWDALQTYSSSAPVRNTQPVDCRADLLLDPPHGDGTLKRYPANGSLIGPYSALPANTINWLDSATNRTYTFFTGNYVNYWYTGRTTTRTRLQIVQEVTKETLASLTNANVGLMRFSTDAQGGMMVWPVADLATSRASLDAQVDGLTANGATPLQETLYEATLYFRGMKWDYGSRSSPVKSIASSRRTDDTTMYKTPSVSDCGKNFIVYLTDGLPNQDIDNETKILNLPNFKTSVGLTCGPNVAVDGGTSGGNDRSGRCFDDLAAYLYLNDSNPNVGGIQNVTLYTIGFGPAVAGSTLLADAARRGGGGYFAADDTATLTTALQQIVRNILQQNTSFTSPAISVNAFNRTQNLNDLYITMFQSRANYRWPGNLKKYRIRDNGVIVGADGEPAVDPATGFVRSNAMSFWREDGDPVDGPDVTLGGAANQLPLPANRKLYTDFVTGNLADPANLVVTTNGAIGPALLGLPASDTAGRDAMIEWVRGADVDDIDEDGDRTDARNQMGDPLHAQPVSVIYGGTATDRDVDDGVVYVATNDGYLHAIRPDTGEELWAFVPTELLPRMALLREDGPIDYKSYGLDGSLRAFRLDKNGNGVVEPTLGDKVWLLFGMGRGGYSYYALDVTDKHAPSLMWRKTPTDYPGLGQTWSVPVVAKVNIDGAAQNDMKLVAVFGGGYDSSQDNVAYNTDVIGNRIFMVDLLSGALLWRAGPTTDGGAQLQLAKMNNSIPADVRLLDMNEDGYADRMYAVDTGARIWRFDIWNGQPAATLVTGGVFASLGVADGTGTDPTDARRFYHAPDVALLVQEGVRFLNIAVGSGFRGSPLNQDIRDRFYSLRDFKPYARLSQADYDAWTPITDATTGIVDATGDDAPVVPKTALGWKMNLTLGGSWAGQKVLAESRTFAGQIFFTTYTPNSASNSCSVNPGTNRLYVVKAVNGGKVENRESKVEDLTSGGIAPTPVFISPSPDNPTDEDSNEHLNDPDPETICPDGDCEPPPQCLTGLNNCGDLPRVGRVRTFWTQQSVDD